MKILAFVKLGGNTAISAVRTLWAMRELNKRKGVECKVVDDGYIQEVVSGKIPEETLFGYDLYILSRIHGKPGRASPFADLTRNGAKLLYDTDDDLTDTSRDMGYGEWVEETIKLTDAVTVSTRNLKDVYSQYGKPTYVIPNLLDTAFYKSVSLSTKRAIPKDKVVIGLVGTRTHWGDWMIPLDAIKRIKAKYPQVFFICGGFIPKYYQGMVDSFIAPVQFALYPAMLRQIDIRLCPLEDTAFNASKSPIAAMEAMASARPIGKKQLGGAVPVVSDCSVFRGTVNHRHNGLVVNGEGWYDAIGQLILDKPLRNKLSATGLRWVRRERDICKGVDQRLHIYRQIAGRN